MSGRSPAPEAATDLAGLSFEDALAELERIVRALEGGQQRLEDAITAYERGSALRQHCEAKLREAEMRVETIVTAADGSLAATQGGAGRPVAERPAAERLAGERPAAERPAVAERMLDEEIPF